MAILDLVTLPVRLTVAAANTTLALGRLVSPDGPVRRPDGYADRVMLLLGENGTVERVDRALSDPRGPMHLVDAVTTVLDADRPLGRALAPGGAVDRLLEEGFVEKLTAEAGTLDQLVALGETLERMQPRIAELLALIPELHESVDTLNRAVGPLSELANRIPGGRPADEA
jgi:hypothetical protein